MQHRLKSDLEQAHFVATFKGFYIPGTGYLFGFGTATPTDEGWAAGAIYVVTGATAAFYQNTGTSTTAVWTAISSEAGSSLVLNAVTAGDSALNITGLAVTAGTGGSVVGAGGATTTSGVGGLVSWTGGAGSGTDLGGAASLTGGVGGSTGAIGGAATVTAGAGTATSNGAIAGLVGGASGGGATGNGGVARVIGGAAASTNGTGGAAQLTGGLATGTGTGGASTITAGASGGAGGTAGSVNLASGAAAGGTEGSVNVQTVSTGKVGFYGVTAVTRPTAYTQTYATADKTHANPTATSVVTTAVTQTTPYGYAGAAQGDAVATTINAIIVDLADLKQLTNSVIDDLQALGLLQ